MEIPGAAEKLYGNPPRNKDYGYGRRPDGSLKGLGFLGPLKRPDGAVMTEFSVGVNLDGQETDIPTLVPSLTKDEVEKILKLGPKDRLPDEIVKKAIEHARKRKAEGKSPFFGPEDEN